MVIERLLFCVVIVFGALALSLIAHEVGHLIGGWLAGYRFCFLRLGLVGVTRRKEGIRVHWLKGPTAGWGAGSFPTDVRRPRLRSAVMIAGGPIANLLVGLLTGILYLSRHFDWSAQTFLTSASSAFGYSLLSAAVCSLFLIAVSLIPRRVGGRTTDGAKLLVLFHGGAKAERQVAIMALAGMSHAGWSAKELPDYLVEAAVALPDGSPEDTAGALSAYSWSMARGSIVEAGEYLNRALAGAEEYPAASRPAIYLEAAYYTAWHRKDAATAREYLGKSRGGLFVKRYSELFAEAAVLFAEGAHASAIKRAREALQTIQNSVGPKPSEAPVRTLNEIVDRCKAALLGPDLPREPVKEASPSADHTQS